MMLIPAARAALRDPDMRVGRMCYVYFSLFEILSIDEYRPLKHSYLAHQLKISRRSVVPMVRRLVDNGYLDHRRTPGQVGEYRLRYEVRSVGVQSGSHIRTS